MTIDIEQQREELLAVRMENGKVRLLKDMEIISGGIIEGREPDGEVIYLRNWREVTVPTVAGLRHMIPDIPHRQKQQIRGGDEDEHEAIA
jgi:hypothetical protein